MRHQGPARHVAQKSATRSLDAIRSENRAHPRCFLGLVGLCQRRGRIGCGVHRDRPRPVSGGCRMGRSGPDGSRSHCRIFTSFHIGLGPLAREDAQAIGPLDSSRLPVDARPPCRLGLGGRRIFPCHRIVPEARPHRVSCPVRPAHDPSRDPCDHCHWVGGSPADDGRIRSQGGTSRDDVPWLPDIPLDPAIAAPEIALVVLAIAFFLVLGAFVLFLVWLPAVFLVISLLTFGAWWRLHRVAFVMTNQRRPADLKAVGEDLLGRGAILSRTWDGYLEVPSMRVAADRRRSYGMSWRFFVLFGIASLGLASVLVAERFFPSPDWTYAIVPLAGAGLLFFAALLGCVYRLQFR